MFRVECVSCFFVCKFPLPSPPPTAARLIVLILHLSLPFYSIPSCFSNNQRGYGTTTVCVGSVVCDVRHLLYTNSAFLPSRSAVGVDLIIPSWHPGLSRSDAF
ncbi:hypothetical protein EDB83DRAFT_2404013 [Lactarius deliciosus]|nr:hypothetical protein EDB83DRAFT_2404013 [Lactarius deliciosus]